MSVIAQWGGVTCTVLHHSSECDIVAIHAEGDWSRRGFHLDATRRLRRAGLDPEICLTDVKGGPDGSFLAFAWFIAYLQVRHGYTVTVAPWVERAVSHAKRWPCQAVVEFERRCGVVASFWARRTDQERLHFQHARTIHLMAKLTQRKVDLMMRVCASPWFVRARLVREFAEMDVELH